MRLADLASILAQGCTLWTDSFKLSGTPARSGGFRFYKKAGGQLLAARRMVLFVQIVIPGFIVLVILVFVIGRLGLAFFFLALF